MEEHEDPPGHQLLTWTSRLQNAEGIVSYPAGAAQSNTMTAVDLHSAFGAPLTQPKCASRTAVQAPAVSFVDNSLCPCLEMNFLTPKFSSTQKGLFWTISI